MSAVIITLGGGAELVITSTGYLLIQEGLKSVNLGRATPERIEALQSYLERLKVHT